MDSTSGEWVLCAANWYDDGRTYHHQPVNITTGFVMCGHRHHNIITQMHELGLDSQDLRDQCEQGFITSKNRWVDRKEAFRIAQVADQLSITELRRRGVSVPWQQGDDNLKLYSEDLY